MNPAPTLTTSKVYYRPIEAAIRWCGLEAHEPSITKAIGAKILPEVDDFPQWPALRLNAERIIDAMANHELPFGIDGVTVQSGFRLDHPRLTVRHVDLREWMLRYYPFERPVFLFDSAGSTDFPEPGGVRSVVRERDELHAALAQRDDEVRRLREQVGIVRPFDRMGSASDSSALTVRAESTYLHIIGVMLRLLLSPGPTASGRISFATQESVVNAMVDQYGKALMGITERTLHAKFAAANRKIEGR